MNLMANFDHGTLPAGSINIKADLKMDNLQYGMLGSVVFGGEFAGSILATFL